MFGPLLKSIIADEESRTVQISAQSAWTNKTSQEPERHYGSLKNLSQNMAPSIHKFCKKEAQLQQQQQQQQPPGAFQVAHEVTCGICRGGSLGGEGSP